MKVRECMTADVITVEVGDPIRRAWDLVEEKKFRRFPVMDGGDLVGIITDRDLRNATAATSVLTEKKSHDGLLDGVRVGSIMTASPLTVGTGTDLSEAARIILEMKIGGLPVIESGRLVGIITETDLVRTLLLLLGSDPRPQAT